MKYAPIILFCYCRPTHLKKVFDTLKTNKEALDSDLIIYSDGPKGNSDIEGVIAVRKYISTIQGFKSIKIIESKINKGLANSIIDGVTDVLKQYDRVIVLEDDIEVSSRFLEFMNKSLKIYEHEEKVMHINGWVPSNIKDNTSPFFTHIMECWGWATWRRSWNHFNKNCDALLTSFSKKDKFKFNINNSYDNFIVILQNKSGEKNTWAIFWYASIFLKRCLCLSPNMSLTNNIGTDGTGDNFNFITSKYQTSINQHPIKHFPTKIIDSQKMLNKYVSFYNSHKISFLSRLKIKIKKILRFNYFN